MKELLALAFAIAGEGFKNKLDKGGRPYMLHNIFVMMGMDTDAERILALLHDTVEDEVVYHGEVITIAVLRRMGFPEDILRDLELLTHIKGEDYLGIYIKKIATSPRATKVKLRDLEHNTQVTRLKGLSRSDFERMEKYYYAFTYLSGN
jgi:(p)ppGpp synthase/HD superfamily hydrolase